MILLPLLPKLLLNLLLSTCLVQAFYRGQRNHAEVKGNSRGRFLMDGPGIVETSAAPSLVTIAPSSAPVNWNLGYDVDILDFVVTMTNSTYATGITSYLNALLANKLKKEFESLLQVVVQLNFISANTGPALTDELHYSGRATFAEVVPVADVDDEQTRVLVDLGNFNVSSPNVISITMGSRTTTTAAPGASPAQPAAPGASPAQQLPTSDAPSLLGPIIGVIVSGAVVLGLSIYLGCKYYTTQPTKGGSSDEATSANSPRDIPESVFLDESQLPDDYSRSVISYGMNTENDDLSLGGVSILNSESGFDNSHQAATRPTPADDNSVASTNDSEAGLDPTQLYLARRLKEKEKKHQLAMLAPQDPLCLYEFDGEFSYDFEWQKFMESDDEDLYLTDNEMSVAGSEQASEHKECEKHLPLMRWKLHKARMAASAGAR